MMTTNRNATRMDCVAKASQYTEDDIMPIDTKNEKIIFSDSSNSNKLRIK